MFVIAGDGASLMLMQSVPMDSLVALFFTIIDAYIYLVSIFHYLFQYFRRNHCQATCYVMVNNGVDEYLPAGC